MPQGRRKVPFSGKKKKEQLLAKRQVKSRNWLNISNRFIKLSLFFVAAKVLLKKSGEESSEDEDETIQKLNYQSNKKRNANRYALEFYKETKEELKLMKEQAQNPFVHVSEEEREIDCKYFNGYDFPVRPEWNYGMSKEELDRNENRYFTVDY